MLASPLKAGHLAPLTIHGTWANCVPGMPGYIFLSWCCNCLCKKYFKAHVFQESPCLRAVQTQSTVQEPFTFSYEGTMEGDQQSSVHRWRCYLVQKFKLYNVYLATASYFPLLVFSVMRLLVLVNYLICTIYIHTHT